MDRLPKTDGPERIAPPEPRTAPAAEYPTLAQALLPFEQPLLRKAVWQIFNTIVPYFALWALMIYTVKQHYPYWITLLLAALSAALLVRIFIIFHDCCHGSYFRSRRANRIIGHISGILTFTPFEYWWRKHSTHHATAGDLDRRGVGDVWTMTVKEFREASRFKRLQYRLYRSPLVMLGLGPVLMFLVTHRHPGRAARRRDHRSVHFTNAAIVAIIIVAGISIGVRTYLLIQIPILLMAGIAGVWLFYVQHQFEGVYWKRENEWDAVSAALQGSSYYKLPKIMQWFSGNIGLHHIHHVRPKIPNYSLQACHDHIPEFACVQPLGRNSSASALRVSV